MPEVARITKQRRAVLDALQGNHGRVDDQKGGATSKLHALLPGFAETSLAGVLQKMEELGLIEREMNGKRTYAIKLPYELPAPEPEAEPAASEDVVDERPLGVDYRHVADELLLTVCDILGKDTHILEEHIQDLTDRLARVERERDRLSSAFATVQDELRFTKRQLDASEAARMQAEANLDCVVKNGHIDPTGERNFRNLDRFIRESPGMAKANA